MLATFFGAFFGSVVGLLGMALIVTRHNARLADAQQARMTKELTEIRDHFEAQIQQAIAEEQLRDLTTIPQPRVEA